MPERQDLDLHFTDAVVEVVPDARQVDATNSHEARVTSLRSDVGIAGEQLEGALEIVAKGMRRVRTMIAPPRKRRSDVSLRAARRP